MAAAAAPVRCEFFGARAVVSTNSYLFLRSYSAPYPPAFHSERNGLEDRRIYVNYFEQLAVVRSYFKDLPLPLPTSSDRYGRLAAGT
jgi:hypothetical protein